MPPALVAFRGDEGERGRGEREAGDVCVCAGGSHASVSIQRTAKQMSRGMRKPFVRTKLGLEWLECKLLPRQPDYMPDAPGCCR